MEKTNIFKCKPQEVHFTITNRVPYNKLLTNLGCSSRTGEHWPSVVFVRTSLRSVHTVTTSRQYSPVRPSRSVSERLLSYDPYGPMYVSVTNLQVLLNPLYKKDNTWAPGDMEFLLRVQLDISRVSTAHS